MSELTKSSGILKFNNHALIESKRCCFFGPVMWLMTTPISVYAAVLTNLIKSTFNVGGNSGDPNKSSLSGSFFFCCYTSFHPIFSNEFLQPVIFCMPYLYVQLTDFFCSNWMHIQKHQNTPHQKASKQSPTICISSYPSIKRQNKIIIRPIQINWHELR
jgi:hypothetical protein